MEQRRLGRGLQSLISSEPSPAATATVAIELLSPNRSQPRESFDEAAIERLSESVARSGILQPIAVRQVGKTYEIIAGERRWRAAKRAGLREVPIFIRQNVTDGEMLELALLENVQRIDLNPIEKAKGFRHLIADFRKTQDEIAKAVGQDRATVANTLRLLELPIEMQEAVQRGALGGGHARALLSVPDASRRRALFERTLREDLSVRDVETLAAEHGARKKAASRKRPTQPAWLTQLEDRWRRRLGVKVGVTLAGQRARISIQCGSFDELERVSDLAVGLPAKRSEVRDQAVSEE
jgi:ParB family chromosome partitioning protein